MDTTDLNPDAGEWYGAPDNYNTPAMLLLRVMIFVLLLYKILLNNAQGY